MSRIARHVVHLESRALAPDLRDLVVEVDGRQHLKLRLGGGTLDLVQHVRLASEALCATASGKRGPVRPAPSKAP